MKIETIYQLPQWLDSYIYNSLGAMYYKSCSNMTVIDWGRSEVLNYLGTYFPRSYVEARSIINSNILHSLKPQNELSILDLGCGTGGEIIGILTNIEESLPGIMSVNLIGIDGNQYALKIFEKVLSEYKKHSKLNISYNVAPVIIEDFYDLSVLDEIITGKFDLIISFKAICEFVTREQFEGKNPYTHIVNTYLPRLTKNGLMVLEDVTTYCNVSSEWLPTMMDKGLIKTNSIIVSKNDGYNQTFQIRHSRVDGYIDISKVCWRIIKNK